MIVPQGKKLTLTPAALDTNGKPVPNGLAIVWTIDTSTALLVFTGPGGAWFDVTVLPTAVGGVRTVTATDENGKTGTYLITIPTIAPAPDAPNTYQIVGSAPRTNKFKQSSIPAGAFLVITPNGVTFPPTAVGVPSAVLTFTVKNIGTKTANISAVNTTGDFAYTGGTLGGTLAPGATATSQITFTPTVAGERTGTYSPASDSPGGNIVNLNGVGV